jgi:probable HAF family extracellular repeat protein
MKSFSGIALLALIALSLSTRRVEAQSYTVVPLGTFGGANGTEATALDDQGKAVGWSWKGTGVELPFLWTSAQGIRSLGSLSGKFGAALGVSSSAVVGWSQSSQGRTHASFGSLAPDCGTWAHLAASRARLRV